jgi:hypothetical protein
MTPTFIIMRKEGEGFAPRGPIAKALTLEDAQDEAVNLKKQYPAQHFAIFAEYGSPQCDMSVSLDLASSPVTAAIPMRRARS